MNREIHATQNQFVKWLNNKERDYETTIQDFIYVIRGNVGCI